MQRIAAVAEYIRILVVLVVLSTVVCVLFPARFLTILYSPKFATAIPIVAVFVLAEAMLLVAGVYQAPLIGFDDGGGMGVGLAFLVGNSVILLATAGRLWYRLGASRVCAPVGPLTVAVGGAAALGWWATGSDVSIPLRLTGYGIACGVALLFLGPDERRWVMRPWSTPLAPRPR